MTQKIGLYGNRLYRRTEERSQVSLRLSLRFTVLNPPEELLWEYILTWKNGYERERGTVKGI